MCVGKLSIQLCAIVFQFKVHLAMLLITPYLIIQNMTIYI